MKAKRRLLIFAIAIAWAVWLVCIVDFLGNHYGWKAFDYISNLLLLLIEAFIALICTIPLFGAAFLVVEMETRWRKYVRRLYATLMLLYSLIETVPFLDPFWDIYSFPASWISLILLWPEIDTFYRTRHIQRLVLVSGFSFAIFGGAVWWHWFHVPLPSDKIMIEYFNIHRLEFEQIVEGFRNQRYGDLPFPQAFPRILELMKLTNVYSVEWLGDSFNDGGKWYPEPYSAHTLQVMKLLEQLNSITRETKRERLKILHQNFPAMLADNALIHSFHDIKRLISPIKISFWSPDLNRTGGPWIRLRKQEEKATRCPRYLRTVLYLRKGFCYYPQPPIVEKCHIINPEHLLGLEKSKSGIRVKESLDKYPSSWKEHELVLKRIDDHWFIFMLLYPVYLSPFEI